MTFDDNVSEIGFVYPDFFIDLQSASFDMMFLLTYHESIIWILNVWSFRCVTNKPRYVFDHLEPFDAAILHLYDNYNDLKKLQNVQKCNSCRVYSNVFSDCKSIVCEWINNLVLIRAMQQLYYVRYAVWENFSWAANFWE